MDTIFDNLGPIMLALAGIAWIYLCYIKPYFDEQARLKAEFAARLAAEKLQADRRRYLLYATDGVDAIRAIKRGDQAAALDALMRALCRD